MPFLCPGCRAPVDASPESWALRCTGCGRLLRSRAVDAGREVRVYEVEIAGRPETRQRVEIPWDQAQSRRLAAWLALSSAITAGLVVVLYILARWLR